LFGKKPVVRPPALLAQKPASQHHILQPANIAQLAALRSEMETMLRSPAKLLMTDEECGEFIERQRAQLRAFIDRINGSLPDGVNVASWCMVPERVWSSVHGGFLLKVLQITPYGAWNILPLPKDERSAGALGLAMARPGPGDKFVEGLVEHIGTFVREIRQVSQENAAAMASGQPPRFERSTEVQDKVRRQMRGIGFYIAGEVVGSETLRRSREVFFGEKFSTSPARRLSH
jgi:hypothetical protein